MEYDHEIVKGDLDLSKLDLPKQQVDRTYDEKEIYGLPETSKVVTSPIRINDSTFDGSITCDNMIFNKIIDLSGSNFSKNVHLRGATFNSYVDFSNSIYNSTADFSHSTYNEAVHLSGKYNGTADFSYSRYNDDAYFSSDFSSSKYIPGSTYNGLAYFSKSTYNGPAYFWNSDYNDYVGFHDSTYNASVYFSHFVPGPGYFSYSTYNGKADLTGSTYNGKADFSGSTFNKEAWFWDSTYNGDVDFRDTNFKGSAEFFVEGFPGSSIFRSYLLLTRAHFSNLIIHWNDVNSLICEDGTTYLSLIKNARDSEQFEASDGIYYQYRVWRQTQRSWSDWSKYSDMAAWASCGYGVKPRYTFFFALGILLVFGFPYLYFMRKNDYFRKMGLKQQLSESFWFSAMVLLSVPNELYPEKSYKNYASKIRYNLPVLERLIGWGLLIVFINTMSRVMIHY